MQVSEVLNKITERNAPVVGCIARKGDRVYHNLEAFDMNVEQLADTVEDLLNISEMLGHDDAPVDTVFSEYDGNCLIGQRVDDSILVTVSDSLHRAGFKKLQVGLSLQTRLLKKAMDETPVPSPEEASAAPAPEAEAQEQKGPDAPKSTWSKLISAVVASPQEVAAPAPADTAGKKRRVYRGQVYYD